MIITAFGLGIFLGFIFFELTGLTAGGIIVPGYIALFLEEPLRIVSTVIIAGITYGAVILLSKYLILFGRRRFLVAILLGFLLRAAADWLNFQVPETGWDLQAIGYVVPGLIANEFLRQGVLNTILGMGIVSVMVYFILQLII